MRNVLAAFSGTITSPSGQVFIAEPMPRVPYYTQQPVAQTGQPYVVIPETQAVAPTAQPGTVIYPGPTPPAIISSPAVPTLGPALAAPPPVLPPPAPLYPTACYAQIDAIFFTRDVHAGNQPLVLRDIVNPTDPNVVLSTADLSIPFQVGPRITLGHEFDANYSFEASYFGIFNWHDTLNASGANNLNMPGDLGLAGGLAFIGADQVSVVYDSQVNNGELNLLHNYGNISCLVGFRYFELGEHLNITFNDVVDGTGTYDLNAYNNLFGLQGGARLVQACGNWSYDLTGKAGVFGNSISSSQQVLDAGTPLQRAHHRRTSSFSRRTRPERQLSVQPELVSPRWLSSLLGRRRSAGAGAIRLHKHRRQRHPSQQNRQHVHARRLRRSHGTLVNRRLAFN